MSLRISGLATLTRDAEMRATANGGWINFGIACRRKGVSEGMQDVDFFEATYFVKNASSPIMDYLKKGTPIYIDSAEMRADRYEKDGQKRTANKVRVFTFDFLNVGKKKDEENSPAVETKPEHPSAADNPTIVGTKDTKLEPVKEGDTYEEPLPF